MTVATAPGDLPSALGDPALADRLASHFPALFLDYDGVLSPIVERQDAVLDEATRRALVRAAERCAVAADQPRLRITGGKKIFELRPDLDWNKGTAVLWLLKQQGLDREGVVPVYIGDDETDEDAFRALADHGVGVVVAPEVPTAAGHALDDMTQAREFLELVAELVGEKT